MEAVPFSRFEFERPEAQRYRDVGFSVAFALNAAVLLPFALSEGATAITAVLSTYLSSATNGNVFDFGDPVMVASCVLAPSVALGLAFAWLALVKKHGAFILKWILLGAAIFSLVTGLVLLVVYASFGGVGLLLTAAFAYWYYTWVKSRIPFAVESLKVASKAVDAAPSVYPLSFALVVLQLLWVAYWGVGAASMLAWLSKRAPSAEPPKYSQPDAPATPTYGSTWRPDSDSKYFNDPATFTALLNASYFYLVWLLFWGCQIVKNVTHCMVAGVVGDWWFRPQTEASTVGALKRAVTTSFGSVCFGSLILSFLQAVEWIMEKARRQQQFDAATQAGQLLQCFNIIGACLLRLVRQAMEYCTAYAFAAVSIYGLDFKSAGQQTLALLKARGWTAILNDQLLSRLLYVGMFLVSIATSFITAAYLSGYGVDTAVIAAVAAWAAVVALAVTSVAVSVLESSVVTVFVCYAHDPETLCNNHPQQFGALTDAFREAHPKEMTDCGLLTSPFALLWLGNSGV